MSHASPVGQQSRAAAQEGFAAAASAIPKIEALQEGSIDEGPQTARDNDENP